MTIAEAINNAAATLAQQGIQHSRLDAELILRHVLKKERAWLIAHFQDPLDGDNRRLFEDGVGRRARREPLQYIIGEQEFWGLPFSVTPDVLIPRPETELLIEVALGVAENKGGPSTIIDLCTGSGCIAVSLAREMQAARIFATDISPNAAAVARENARTHGVSDRIRFLEGDLFAPLEELDLRGQVDIIVTNPPYVRSDELPALMPEVSVYEPSTALVAGPQGTEVHSRIVEGAPAFLKKGGALIMEMGMGQADALSRLMKECNEYKTPEIVKDLAGIDRVIRVRRR